MIFRRKSSIENWIKNPAVETFLTKTTKNNVE